MEFCLQFLLELGELGRVLEGQDRGFGAESVAQAVQADDGSSLGGFRARGFLRIAAICFDLSWCGHDYVSLLKQNDRQGCRSYRYISGYGWDFELLKMGYCVEVLWTYGESGEK